METEINFACQWILRFDLAESFPSSQLLVKIIHLVSKKINYKKDMSYQK